MHKDELWQEYDKTAIPIGHGSPQKEFGPEGRACGLVHVWLFRDGENGRELLFQKRSMSVDRNPGLWDISAVGHINADESHLDACVREAREEIGADILSQNLLFVLSHFAPVHNTVHGIYLYKWTDSDSFHFDDGEVEAVKWVPRDQILDFVKDNVKPSISSLTWYWEKLLDNLDNL